jgi:hypothetical protein
LAIQKAHSFPGPSGPSWSTFWRRWLWQRNRVFPAVWPRGPYYSGGAACLSGGCILAYRGTYGSVAYWWWRLVDRRGVGLYQGNVRVPEGLAGSSAVPEDTRKILAMSDSVGNACGIAVVSARGTSAITTLRNRRKLQNDTHDKIRSSLDHDTRITVSEVKSGKLMEPVPLTSRNRPREKKHENNSCNLGKIRIYCGAC